MTEEEIRRVVVEMLIQVAPDTDPEALDPAADVREELDIDSMDHLNFVVGLHEATGVAIPERDYSRLTTIDGAVAYLAERLG